MDYKILETITNAYMALRDNRISIAPKANTPISELVKLSTPAIVSSSAPITNVNTGSLYMYSHPSGNSQYDLALSGYTKDITRHVKNHLSFFRNVIHPAINDYSEKVNTAWKNYIPKQPGADFEIVQLDIPSGLDTDKLRRLVKDYDGNKPLPPTQSLMLDTKSKEELLELCVTGDSDLDVAISNWFTTNEYLLYSYFIFLADMEKVSTPSDLCYIDVTGGNWKTNSFQHAGLLGLNPFDRLGLVLPAFIMASRLYSSEVDSGAGNMSLSTYRNIASQIRDYTGSIISMTLKQIDVINEDENIVLEFKEASKVRVYGANYKKWLSEGGSVEAIYGLILSSQKYYSKPMLDQHKERLETLWSNHLTIFTTNQQQKSYIVFRELLLSVFLNSMGDLSEQEKAIVERDPNYVDLAVSIFKNELDTVSTKDMQDLYGVAMRLLTKAKYYYTDSYNFFNTAHNAALTNPNIKDFREAGLVATIDYLITYVLDQVAIVK